MSKVLIVDDDVTFCLMLDTLLRKNGYEPRQAYSFGEGRKQLSAFKPDIVLTDLRLPEHDGMELLQLVIRELPGVPVILMTSYGDIRTAVKAMKMGAFEYVAKPVNPDEILATISRALNYTPPAIESGNEGGVRDTGFYIEGSSDNASKLHEYITLVAPTNMSVLITGESGTGKEFVARKIHLNSQRSKKPFVPIDCGALPRDLAGSELFGHLKGSFTGAFTDKVGQFEAANTGTIFLDEIGNLSYEIQVQLLRAIQERKIRRIGSTVEIPVDVRIICATNDDLKQAVGRGDFREDLFHRMNEFAMHVAPLRDRQTDMALFTGEFIKQANQELNRNITGLSPEVEHIFLNYSWPGNLRELRNIVKRSVLLTQNQLITRDTLPDELIEESLGENTAKISGQPSAPEHDNSLKESSRRSERDLIISTLEKVRYNKSKAARILNVDRKTLYNKMKQYGIPLQ